MNRKEVISINATEAIEYIHSVCWKGSIPGLVRTQALLEKMGNPEKKLKFVHIAQALTELFFVSDLCIR